MKIGLIGLGRMGSNMAVKLIKDGHEVVVWNRSPEKAKQLKLEIAESIEDLVKRLKKPRIVWTMVTAGETTDAILLEIARLVDKNDIVVDGSNANYKDTERRFKNFAKKKIRFLGIGVSGGIHGPKLGYALMAGGDKSAYEYIIPIMNTLVKPTAGYEYYGEGGAGHFVKMMHNAIEYGYMQSIGEGFDVLKHSPYRLDLLKIAKLWAKNSLVSGFMMDRTVEALEKDPQMEHLEGVIGTTGEADVAVDTAKEFGVPVEIIEASLNYRKRSQTDSKIQKSFTAKLVAALREAFGAHEVKKK